MSQIVILPGGYHPYHAGHYSLYNSAKEQFPDADVYVAATDDTSKRPFPFAIKEKLARVAGVDKGYFVKVKSPFRANEITDNYDPEKDTLIFVRSEKDRNEQPKPGGTKKDGSPSYFQPYTGKNIQPFNKHAYIAYLPTVKFGPDITSATEIRNSWPNLNDRQKLSMVMSLYPATQKNTKLANNVKQLLDAGMGSEEITEGAALSHSAVRKLQGFLNKKFHANLDVDGVLGNLTKQSIEKYMPSVSKQLAPNPNRTTRIQGFDNKKSQEQAVAENTPATGINKMFSNLGDPVYSNLQRVALLAMQGRQQEASGRLLAVIKDARPEVQKKIVNAVNNIKPVTINGKIADSSTLDKSKQHNDWILQTFIPWVQSLLGQQDVAEGCPHCGGEMVSEELMNEKKDACYYKVKSRYKVWPSAYASGALVKCRKKGASNWGNKSESSISEGTERADENLHDWFNKEKWVRMDTKGNIKGQCAKEPGEGKPKCLPRSKAYALGKKGRASAAVRKRKKDPNPDRKGPAINVNTKKKSNEDIQKGMKPTHVSGEEKPGAVKTLEKALLKAKDRSIKLDYDKIDKIMQLICKEHQLTGDKLHSDFAKKHHMVPDKWIVKQTVVTESIDYLDEK